MNSQFKQLENAIFYVFFISTDSSFQNCSNWKNRCFRLECFHSFQCAKRPCALHLLACAHFLRAILRQHLCRICKPFKLTFMYATTATASSILKQPSKSQSAIECFLGSQQSARIIYILYLTQQATSNQYTKLDWKQKREIDKKRQKIKQQQQHIECPQNSKNRSGHSE